MSVLEKLPSYSKFRKDQLIFLVIALIILFVCYNIFLCGTYYCYKKTKENYVPGKEITSTDLLAFVGVAAKEMYRSQGLSLYKEMEKVINTDHKIFKEFKDQIETMRVVRINPKLKAEFDQTGKDIGLFKPNFK